MYYDYSENILSYIIRKQIHKEFLIIKVNLYFVYFLYNPSKTCLRKD